MSDFIVNFELIGGLMSGGKRLTGQFLLKDPEFITINIFVAIVKNLHREGHDKTSHILR